MTIYHGHLVNNHLPFITDLEIIINWQSFVEKLVITGKIIHVNRCDRCINKKAKFFIIVIKIQY